MGVVGEAVGENDRPPIARAVVEVVYLEIGRFDRWHHGKFQVLQYLSLSLETFYECFAVNIRKERNAKNAYKPYASEWG